MADKKSDRLEKIMIMVVEDDAVVANAIRQIIKSIGMRSYLCDTAAKARQAFSTMKPDIVVLDIQLPDELSYDFARLIRKESSARLVFLSARDSEGDKLFGLELGADDYITKPFNPKELAIRLTNIARRVKDRETSKVNIVRHKEYTAFGEWKFSTDRRQLQKSNDKPTSLTKLEAKILSTFTENPGTVFTRQDLVKMSHEGDKTANARTIDILIMRLRRKLGESPAEPHHIITVPGQGYFFQCP